MLEVDALSREILHALSENCRRSVSSLAKELRCAPKTVKKKLLALEKEYNIRYTLELSEQELGFNATYFVLVKFSKPPDEKLLVAALRKYSMPQVAALTKGDFDMFIYVVARTPLEFSKWANYFRQTLTEYIERWEGGLITGFWFGFFPLSEELLEQANINEKEKLMLRLLVRNARISLKDLARRMNMSISTVRYHLNKLLESKIVRRATIIMERPPLHTHYIGVYGYRMTKNFLKNDLGVRALITEEPLYESINRLLPVFNVAGANFDDVIMYSVSDLEDGYNFHNEVIRRFGSELRDYKFAFVLKIVKGNLPFRKVSIKKDYRVDFMDIYDYLEKD